jgi:hypothetical protein
MNSIRVLEGLLLADNRMGVLIPVYVPLNREGDHSGRLVGKESPS